MSFTCQEHARQLATVKNATVCHHYVLAISPYVSVDTLQKDVMNTLNENSFVEEIMGVANEGAYNAATRDVNCLFSSDALNKFYDFRVDTINGGRKYLGKDLVLYIDPGK